VLFQDKNYKILWLEHMIGNPKGAMITHANLIANEAALYERLHKVCSYCSFTNFQVHENDFFRVFRVFRV
jgi:hypothetical protein